MAYSQGTMHGQHGGARENSGRKKILGERKCLQIKEILEKLGEKHTNEYI